MTAKIIKALGVAAGLGVAACPLATFAVDPATAEADVNVTVNQVISMAIDSSSVDTVALDPSQKDITTIKHITKVSTNSAGGYTLTLKDKDTSNDLVHTTNSNFKIQSADGEPATSSASWAVLQGSAWKAMPKSNETALTMKTAAALTNAVYTDDTTTIQYGVSTDGTLASGTYSDTVVYTATAN